MEISPLSSRNNSPIVRARQVSMLISRSEVEEVSISQAKEREVVDLVGNDSYTPEADDRLRGSLKKASTSYAQQNVY